jgi:outer membrane lipoprotein carrier protein
MRFVLLNVAATLVLCAPFAGAQNRGVPNALELAAKIDAHYNHLRTLRLNFSENYRGMGMNRAETGTLQLAKPGKMRWEYSKPSGKLFLLNGQFAYSWAPGDGQVQKIRSARLDDLRSPMRLLLGRTKLEKELSNLAIAPTETLGVWRLIGTAPALKDRIQRITLTAKQDGTLLGIEIVEMDGSETRFEFSNEQDNAAPAPGAFEFHAPEGVPIIEVKPPREH